MKDRRISILAKQTMEYSLGLQPGEKVLIEAWDGREDFVLEFVKAAQELGAMPYVSLQNRAVQRLLLMGADEAYLKSWCGYELPRMDDMDACLTIRGENNASEFADVPAECQQLYSRYSGIVRERQRNFKMRWCILRYPSASMAQMCGLSTEAFEDFFFSVNCIVMLYKKSRHFPLKEKEGKMKKKGRCQEWEKRSEIMRRRIKSKR